MIVKEIPHILSVLHWEPKEVIKRWSNLIAYNLFGSYAASPKRLAFYITYRCNLRCKMCWWWGESGIQPTSGELSTSEVKYLLNEMKSTKPFISFGGGEPLIRKDLLEILEYAKQQGLRCEILTNGTLITQELARELTKLVDHLIFSVDGPREINDYIRGKGSFDRTISGIRLVQEAAKISQKKGRIRLTCTISSLNLPYLDEMVDLAHTMNCDLSFQHLMFSNYEVVEQHEEFLRDNLSLEDKTMRGFISNFHELDVALLIKKLHMSREKAKQLKVPFIVSPFLRGDKEMQAWYSNLSPIPHLRCTFPWTYLFIKPDGEVLPCEFIDYSFGNILQEDVQTIWNGPKARYFRKTLKKNLFPGCARCCKLLSWPLI